MDDDRVRVTGTVIRVVQPDQAKITLRVREIDADPREAYDRCAPRATAVTTGLGELLGGTGSVAARAVTVRRHWAETEDGGDRLLHEAVCRIVAECPADQAGRVLTEAIRLGADEAGHVEYAAGERDAVELELLAEAVGAARRKAERLAEAAGRPLGAVVALEEPHDGEYGVAASAVMELGGGDDHAIEIEPSEIRLAKSIRVTFALG